VAATPEASRARVSEDAGSVVDKAVESHDPVVQERDDAPVVADRTAAGLTSLPALTGLVVDHHYTGQSHAQVHARSPYAKLAQQRAGETTVDDDQRIT
jgi:hypothetical protein